MNRWLTLSTVCGGGLLGIIAWTMSAEQVEISGTPRVVDGDTIAFGPRRVRLWGIDAPEMDQTCVPARAGETLPGGVQVKQDYLCGVTARTALVYMIEPSPVRCEGKDIDRYGRTVAVCRRGTLELNREMVRLGWAIEYKRYSHGAYAAEEAEARAAKRGIWAGAFDEPEVWRRTHPK